MTAISRKITDSPLEAAPVHHHAADHAHHEISFIKRYIFSTDHKIIGIEFMFVAMAFFVLGGLLALLVRWQLGFPGHAVPIIGSYMESRGWTGGVMPPDFYTSAFSMHATFMIFFVVIPLLVGTFGNYLIPLKIGAPDMAVPFLNGFSFWLAVPAGALMLTSLFLQGGASQAGWTGYPPLSAISLNDRGHAEYVKPANAFDAFMQHLRVHDLGAHFTGAIEQSTNAVGETFEGDSARIIEGIRGAAGSLDWTVTEAAADHITLKPDTGPALTAKLSESAVTIAATDDAVANARKLLARTGTRLKDPGIVGKDAGKAWQSSWNDFALLSNFAAWFLSFLFLSSYLVKLGSRSINIPVAVIISGTLAFFVLRGLQIAAFDGQSAWFLSVLILGFSSILGAVNYLTTIVKLRCPGMTMFRLPLSVWALFITSILVLLATPVLAGVMLMNLCDHHRLTSFFEPFNWLNSNNLQDVAGGGNALLHEHLFWFYSHPAVYIMIVPAMGMVSDILAVFARKPVFGYRPMVYAMAAIAFLGLIVWAHHMFQSGMNPTLGTTFAISTMFIAVPSAIKTFNWLGTLWGGNIRFTTPMLNALAFVSMFIIGGLSGIFMASTAVDVQIHATYFIVAHIHYVLFGGSIFGIFAAIYFWYPKMFGRMMNETLGKIHFWLSFIAFNCTFFPMHFEGLRGMPRRVYDPHIYNQFKDLLSLDRFMTISAFVLGFAQIFFAINFIGSWIWGKKAPGNPWQATTLEWNDAPSPPPHLNFAKTPIVHHGPYEYSSPLVEEDWLPQTKFIEGDDQFAPVAH
jgi:heme/copper-type cytochrome/quinol oxidase subunit 1